MHIAPPYLLFIGDATDQLSIKMARGAADWCPELCIGEYSMSGCTVTTGIPKMDIATAAKNGAKSFVLGFANSGGILDEKWLVYIFEAMDNGMDIVSGLHDKLTDFPEIVEKSIQKFCSSNVGEFPLKNRFKTSAAPTLENFL